MVEVNLIKHSVLSLPHPNYHANVTYTSSHRFHSRVAGTWGCCLPQCMGLCWTRVAGGAW